MRILLVLLALSLCPAFCAEADFNGRWNIRVEGESRARAWWLEVTGAGTPEIKGRFVGAPGGGMDDIPEISVRDNELRFAFNRRYRRTAEDLQPETNTRGVYSAVLGADGKLHGTFALEGYAAAGRKWTGTRAPVIKDRDDGTWKEGPPVALFNGRDLTGWRAMVPGRELGWTAKDGIMVNVAGANNLVSEQKFWNFRLLAEYRLGPRSNSGFGLRGRYEVQVMEDAGRPPSKQSQGSIYSRIPPTVNASRPAGEWQSMEVRLVGRTVTVVLNGTTVVDKGEIEGLTAMAHDPEEDKPGSISLQGDHGSVEIRKLVVIPLTR